MKRHLGSIRAVVFWAGVLWAAFLATASAADQFPALHDVTGVATNDVLNVRAQPNAGSNKLGALGPGQRNVEVVGTDATGRWGLVNVGETSGWAALRYLRRQAGDPGYIIAASLTCFGTEPFWSLRLKQGQSGKFSTPSQVDPLTEAGFLIPGANRPDRFFVGLGTTSMAILRREICSDGMSDRTFGIAIDLLSNRGDTMLYSGCCSIASH